MSDSSEKDVDDGGDSKQFMFHKCSSNVLERVSFRYSESLVHCGQGIYNTTAITQMTLMKFIRNSPMTMRWFRSNLTKDNTTIVQQERPALFEVVQ